MKKLLPFLLAALLPLTAHAQRQSVTVDPNGLGAGTFNTAGINYYYMGANTYDFTGSILVNGTLVASATAVYYQVSQANSFVAGQPVTVNGSGTWVGAFANGTLAQANAVGVVSSTGLSAGAFQVVIDGICPIGGSALTTGSIYYVPLSAGIVTSTAPSVVGQYVYPLATAISPSILVVSISTPSIVTTSGGVPGLGNNNTWTGTNTFNNTVSGTGITSLFASPPAIGGTVAAAGSFTSLSSTGVTALGGAAGGISTPGMISIGNNTTVSGYALELNGSTPIVANGGSAIQVNTQLTAGAANTYNFENFAPTFNTSTYTGNTLNSINVGTPTVNTTGGGTVTGGYQINVAAPASGQAGALNIASGAVNLGSGTTTVGGNLAVTGTVSGTGITNLFASPPAIGGTAAAAGSFTTLSATGAVNLGSGAITSTGSMVLNSATGGSQGAGTINATGLYVNGVSVGGSIVGSNNTWTGTNTFNNTVSGTGVTSLFASPPAIGGTAAAAGSFTTLSATGAVNLGSGAITSTGSMVLNSATGGSQGAGTINATGLYVNGVSVGSSIVGSNNTWTGTNTFNNTTTITSTSTSPSLFAKAHGNGAVPFLMTDATATDGWTIANTMGVDGTTAWKSAEYGFILGTTGNSYFDSVASFYLTGDSSTVGLYVGKGGAVTIHGGLSLTKTIASGTGAQTQNTTTGEVQFAGAATSLVVTNSLCSSTSIITATICTNDATAVLGNVVKAAGSFTINMKTAPTGTTLVDYRLTN